MDSSVDEPPWWFVLLVLLGTALLVFAIHSCSREDREDLPPQVVGHPVAAPLAPPKGWDREVRHVG